MASTALSIAAEGRHEEDGHVGSIRLTPVEHVEAVDVLHAQVGHDDVGRIAAEALEGRGPAVGDFGLEPGRLEIVGHRLAMSTTSSTTRARGLRMGTARGAPRSCGPAEPDRRALAGRAREVDFPPWLRTMLGAMESPSPVPSPRFLVVKKGSKTAFMCSSAMPQPASMTSMSTIVPRRRGAPMTRAARSPTRRTR